MKRGITLLALLFPLVGAAPALADDGSTTASVRFTNEAWFSAGGLCAAADGLCGGTNAVLPADPYPTGTLHVAETLGQETARTYLTPAQLAPTGSTLVDANLTVPLDTATLGDGSLNPSTATVWVCTTTVAVPAGEAQAGDAPTADCDTHAELDYVAGSVPQLYGDLTPILPQLARTGTSLVLVPATAAAGSTATWHVAFSDDARTDPPTPAPSLQVTYAVAAATATPTASAPETAAPQSVPRRRRSSAAPVTRSTAAPPAAATVGGSAALPVDNPPATTGPVVTAPTPAVADTDAGQSVTAPQAVTQAASVQEAFGFVYPAVLLLPLVMLAVFYAVGRQLTSPIRASRRTS